MLKEKDFFGCYVSVDGTDVQIFELSPFSTEWYIYKFKSGGLRYEVGVSIEKENLVWVNGPYPCGNFQIWQYSEIE